MRTIRVCGTIFLFSIIILMCISCQIQNSSLSESHPYPIPESNSIKTTVPLSTNPTSIVPTTASIATSTPAPTPLILPTPTNQPIPSTTAPFLEKVTDLSISGSTIEISEDGSLLGYVDQNNGSLNVYDMERDTVLWEFEDEPIGMVGFSTLDFSPDGALLAAAGVEKDTFVWDLITGELKFRIEEPYHAIDQVSFSPDSQLLSIGTQETYSADAAIMIHSMSTGEVVDKFPSQNILAYPETQDEAYSLKSFRDFGWSIGDAIFVPNQSNLLAITVNYSENSIEEDTWALYFWDIENQILKEILPGSLGEKIAISSNGRLLATEIDSKLYSWDFENEREVFVQEQNVKEQLTYRMSLNDDGILARLSWNGNLTIWGSQGDLLAEIMSEKFITDITFTSDGNLLVAYLITDDGTTPPIELWHVGDGE